MRICVIIPTYNEAKNIGEIVGRIRRQNIEVVVVDDGSADNTAAKALESGAVVLKNPLNLGKGTSLVAGFAYCLERGFDAIVTMDGDGQHLPEDLPFFLRLAENSNSAVLVGNRMSQARGMPLIRVVTNKVMSWLISKIAKQRIPDTQCGFRLIKREVLEKVRLGTKKYETESELLIKASRAGFKIESVPIKAVYRGEKSQINPFVDTLRFVKYIIKELWTTRS